MYYLEHIEERSILINNSVCPLLRLRWSICQCLVLVDIERKIAAFKVLCESLVVVEVVVVVVAAARVARVARVKSVSVVVVVGIVDIVVTSNNSGNSSSGSTYLGSILFS